MQHRFHSKIVRTGGITCEKLCSMNVSIHTIFINEVALHLCKYGLVSEFFKFYFILEYS